MGGQGGQSLKVLVRALSDFEVFSFSKLNLQLCTGCVPHPHPGHLLQQPKLEARPAGVPGLVDGVAGAGAALHGGGSFR